MAGRHKNKKPRRGLDLKEMKSREKHDSENESPFDEVEVTPEKLKHYLRENETKNEPQKLNYPDSFDKENKPDVEIGKRGGAVDFQQPTRNDHSSVGKSTSLFQNNAQSYENNYSPVTSGSSGPLCKNPRLECGGSIFPPYDEDDIIKIKGAPKGIQGFANSCYMDTTLFAMFSFTSIFDKLILEDPESWYHWSSLAVETQRILREKIVNPLRKDGLTPAKNVMTLRDTLYSLNHDLVGKEMDPLEFLRILFEQVLKLQGFLFLSTGESGFAHHIIVHVSDQIRANSVPTVQDLLGFSFGFQNVSLTSVPSPALLLLMPRHERHFRSFACGVIPNLTINITDLVQPGICSICGKLATDRCRDCANNSAGIKSFCSTCDVIYHGHPTRSDHKNRYALKTSTLSCKDSGILTMDLLSVICIRTNHFVAFVRCGRKPSSPWVYFNSMSDVCRLAQDKYHHIPEVEVLPKMGCWLTSFEAMSQKDRRCNIENSVPDLKLLLRDPYIYMYAPSANTN